MYNIIQKSSKLSSKQLNSAQVYSISSASSSSEELVDSYQETNILSHPLTKSQLEKAKVILDSKIEINKNLPDKQAYIDRDGHIKVAKVTRYIPTKLVLTKSGELVLKNAQQQVNYMNFIGESTTTGTDNKKANIESQNLNLQIQKLMNKVNNLSASINSKSSDKQGDSRSNPFLTVQTGQTFDSRSEPSTPSTPIGSSVRLNGYSKVHSMSNNPFASPTISINAQKSNTEGTLGLLDANGNDTILNASQNTKDNTIGPTFMVGNNSNMSTATKSSAESVTSSAFIENNFPKFVTLNNPEYKLPHQKANHHSKTTALNGNKSSSGSGSSTSKRIYSSISKKFKTSSNQYAEDGGVKEMNDKYSAQLKKKQTDWNNVDLRTYNGLLPWESHVELMKWIDPQPSFPPSYQKCNPQSMGKNSGVHFPIYEDDETTKLTAPPDYQPGIEGITIVAMKLEFLSPFDRAMMRYWKYYILELNSTQINFYHLDDELTSDITNFRDGKDDSCQIREKEKNYDFSSYTDMYDVVNGKKVWANNGTGLHNSHFNSLKDKSADEYIMSKAENRQILQKVMDKPAKYLTNERLCKSFTLQNSDFGIATDCNERSYILRVRCEMEQFLLSFSSVMDMINWSVYLSVGIGISLDLDERSYPNYRIVPIGSSRSRRRRRRRLREERRQRMLSDYENRKKLLGSQTTNNNAATSNVRKNSSGLINKSSFMKLSSRLRSGSHSSNNSTGANIEAVEHRRASAANLHDSIFEDETSSLLELCSTIEADRRRRMSETNLSVSNNSFAETGSQASNDTEGELVEDAIDDIDYPDYEYEYDDPMMEINASGPSFRRQSNNSTNTIHRGEDIGINVAPADDTRQIERENRMLMEEYTSLTIKRVMREDDMEDNNMNVAKKEVVQTIDRSNPALVLTHALTSVQFAPSKKKNNAVLHKKNGSRDMNGQPLRCRSSSTTFKAVSKMLGEGSKSGMSPETLKPVEKPGKKFISKLFGKKNIGKSGEFVSKKTNSDSVGITVDNVITLAANGRRKSLADKRDVKLVSVQEPTNPECDQEESTILAEERNIMEDELQLESADNDDTEMNKVMSDPKVSPPLEGSENAYEREGLQVEEAGDYIYQPQMVYSSINQVGRSREPSFSSSENRTQRQRSASYHSQLMNFGSGANKPSEANEKYVWAPPKKVMTKKKYIREAIGCIKPLLENETWQGKVISTPCLAPEYETNNPPISGIQEELVKVDLESTKNSSIFKYGFSQHETKKKPKFKLILRKCKNHYLKQSVVGPSGYVKL